VARPHAGWQVVLHEGFNWDKYPIDHFRTLDEPENDFFPKSRWRAWLRIWFFRLYIHTSVGKSIRVRVHPQVRRALWWQYSEA